METITESALTCGKWSSNYKKIFMKYDAANDDVDDDNKANDAKLMLWALSVLNIAIDINVHRWQNLNFESLFQVHSSGEVWGLHWASWTLRLKELIKTR